MPVEMRILAWGALLGFAHVMIAIIVKTVQYGIKWNMGARDGDQPPPGIYASRLSRAQANFFETFPIAIVALMGVVIVGRTSPETAFNGWLWLWARVAYLFAYWTGIPYVRTLIFAVAMSGLIGVLKVLLAG